MWYRYDYEPPDEYGDKCCGYPDCEEFCTLDNCFYNAKNTDNYDEFLKFMGIMED
jgi:hypothetical protein